METINRATTSAVPRKYPEYEIRRRKPWGFVFLLILFFVASGVAGYFYWQTKQLPPYVSPETMDVLEKLNTMIVLPADEQPTVATVNDIEKLKGQPFFAKAKVGDRVVIYSKNQKVILFDPVAGKIIEVGSINIDNPIE